MGDSKTVYTEVSDKYVIISDKSYMLFTYITLYNYMPYGHAMVT
jgi:hypothetical protein